MVRSVPGGSLLDAPGRRRIVRSPAGEDGGCGLAELTTHSPEFATIWATGDIADCTSGPMNL